MNSIPIIDVQKLTANAVPAEDWLKIAKSVGDAFHGIGFIYLVNHGIDSNLIETAFERSKSFFELPLEKKLPYKRANATRGYHGGYFTNVTEESSSSFWIKNGKTEDHIFELRESYDFAGRNPVKNEDATDFHHSIGELESACKNTVWMIMKLIGLALQLEDPEHFLKCSKWLSDSSIPTFKTFRSLFYPAIPESVDIPEGKFRVKEHSDFDLFTILFQDSIGGLEVKSSSGTWCPATPVPNSIIINIGDILERWTGGFFPATKHRVRIPNSEIRRRIPRQSMVFFVHTDSNVVIAPLKSSILGNYTFESFKAFDYPKTKLAAISSY